MSKTISVIINTLNRAEHLDTALQALKFQRYKNFEVIVVNGPSTDHTEALVTLYEQVIVARCPEPNLSMSRNIGLAAACGEIVAFLDDDAIPDPSWLRRLESGYASSDIGGIGGYVRDHTGVAYQCKVIVCDRFGDSSGYVTPEDADLDPKPGDWRYFSPLGANISFRRGALLEIGGFDEAFTYFLDETDVCLRLLDAGWRIKFAPGAEVLHKYAPSAQRDARRIPKRYVEIARSKAYFTLRHARISRSDKEIERHLQKYCTAIRRSNAWLVRQGLLGKADEARLNFELFEGMEDGRRLEASTSTIGQSLKPRPSDRPFRPFSDPDSPKTRSRLRMVFPKKMRHGELESADGVVMVAHSLAARGHEVSTIELTDGHPTVDFAGGLWIHRVNLPRGAFDAPLFADGTPDTAHRRSLAIDDEIMRIYRERGLDLAGYPAMIPDRNALGEPKLLPPAMAITLGLAAPRNMPPINALFTTKAGGPYAEAQETVRQNDKPEAVWPAGSIEILCGANLRDPHHVSAQSETVSNASSRMIARGGLEILSVNWSDQSDPFALLIEAAHPLLESSPDLRLRLIGARRPSGSSAGLSERFSGIPWYSRIIFDQDVDLEQLDDAYEACDIFVPPNQADPMGLAALNAMMHAKPWAGAIPSLLIDPRSEEDTGVATAFEDAAELRDALAKLVNDPARRTRLGQAGRRRYAALLSSDALGEITEAHYQAILSRSC